MAARAGRRIHLREQVQWRVKPPESPSDPASRSLSSLLEVTFGPRVVVAEEFRGLGASEIVIFGSWAARFDGEPGPPPGDVDVLVVGSVPRADVYEAADRAQARLGLPANPMARTPEQWADPADPLARQIKASPHVVVLGSAKPQERR